MKKTVSLLVLIAILLTSCTGDQGPIGPPGLDGIDGIPIAASAFEIDVNFNDANEFSIAENYGFQVLISDVTLVYILWETNNGQNIWRLLPQTVTFDDGNLIYNFDFTQTDVRIFLEGTTNFSTLDAEWTQNQVFRVVVIPADNVDGVDLSNINEVMKANNIERFEIK
ncbi:hypothetical protein LX77_00154 [Gelidibacter algens]|jgi:hypothetical protein|uniref:Collagen triple helix repeat protein n=1 Tax=Gelidibacter algens TaxID=49280 RepID=A0A1A7QS24_9FLAO|nr:hypothetical protein [Gelidibacter algens]OBX22316.1 hypothetical protein A9996_17030 [Gelidibacter algens]RAJ27582.1 hypothetical protein LX77_00154 [Gelidibacter algens]